MLEHVKDTVQSSKWTVAQFISHVLTYICRSDDGH